MRWGLALLALVASPLAAQDAAFQPIPPAIVDISQTGTPLQLGDDAAARVDLDFSFDFFGRQYTSAWVSSNGFLSFDPHGHLCCNGAPVSQAPTNAVYGLWMDLISWENPYVKAITAPDGLKSFLAGWYQTQEYGSNLRSTFEIQLFEGGAIELRYGDVGNVWHTASAGIAGPTSADRFSLFYGRQVDVLDNTAWRYGSLVEKVDCEKTPLDPSCPPPVVSAAPTVVATEPVVQAQAADAAAAAQETASGVAAAEEPEPTVETAETASTDGAASASEDTAAVDVTPAEETATASETVAAEAAAPSSADAGGPPPPLPPGVGIQSVGEVAAGAWASPFGPAAPAATASPTVTGSDADQSSPVARTRSEAGSLSSAAALEALSTNGSAAMPVASMQTTSSSDAGAQLGGNQDQAVSEMAATPAGYSQYAAASIPDRPFYPPVQIYGRRRPVDAYLVMYRLLSTNDRVYDRMVEQQYER